MDGFGVWFKHFDKDNSGKIEKNEFAEFVTQVTKTDILNHLDIK
jgi:Ca2+-binding EF-hand superfamily protein